MSAIRSNGPEAVKMRRRFAQSAACLCGMALYGLFAAPAARAQAPAEHACSPTPCLTEIGAIHSSGGKLRAVMKVKNERRLIQGAQKMMRYFEGYDASQGYDPAGKTPWPATHGVAAPGPTLRARVGETVNIMFLNQIDVGAFGATIDRYERGLSNTVCDESANAATGDPDWYPKTAGDTGPNCFHGSSTANMHFHGTHVTPDGLGDNVLLQIRPDPVSATEERWRDTFEKIFDHKVCPENWKNLPPKWWETQQHLLNEYDTNALYKGQRGPLPEALRLLPADRTELAAGLWPQYFIGAYPFCFHLTEKAGHQAGQAPGTHWYHAHKHGSTTVNMLNGLSGAFIIEGQYDDDLKAAYAATGLREKVLVLQQFDDTPNLERAMRAPVKPGGSPIPPGPPPTFVNGQMNPTIEMRPGEIQLWRIVNAMVARTVNGSFDKPDPDFRQIAQDGVQFNWANFEKQPFTPASSAGRKFTLAPGGRIDLLMKAPDNAKPGDIFLLENGPDLLTVSIAGEKIAMDFPDKEHYPRFPESYLSDIPAPPGPQPRRTLKFGWEKNRTSQVRDKAGAAPQFTINDEKFKDKEYQQTMYLGAVEDWKVTNTTTITHPFHIHVNPFQVLEIYDPNQDNPHVYKPEKNFVWQDVVAIPAAKTDDNGKLILNPATGEAKDPGYVLVRQRFVDFAGSFVLHCHILAHEDRGMMQLIRVVDKRKGVPKNNVTLYGHH